MFNCVTSIQSVEYISVIGLKFLAAAVELKCSGNALGIGQEIMQGTSSTPAL